MMLERDAPLLSAPRFHDQRRPFLEMPSKVSESTGLACVACFRFLNKETEFSSRCSLGSPDGEAHPHRIGIIFAFHAGKEIAHRRRSEDQHSPDCGLTGPPLGLGGSAQRICTWERPRYICSTWFSPAVPLDTSRRHLLHRYST